MSTHDAEYFRQRRRAQGIRRREPFLARGFMQRAIELRRSTSRLSLRPILRLIHVADFLHLKVPAAGA
jgi:hypothetical protein